MISDEERREVAAKLRAEADKWRKLVEECPDIIEELSISDVDVIIGFLLNTIGLEYVDLNLIPSFDRLADLIDPTCHVTDELAVAELVDGTRMTGRMLSCGHACFGGVVPKHCAECGARVVNVDDWR